jgi:hypothetical protein
MKKKKLRVWYDHQGNRWSENAPNNWTKYIPSTGKTLYGQPAPPLPSIAFDEAETDEARAKRTR